MESITWFRGTYSGVIEVTPKLLTRLTTSPPLIMARRSMAHGRQVDTA